MLRLMSDNNVNNSYVTKMKRKTELNDQLFATVDIDVDNTVDHSY